MELKNKSFLVIGVFIFALCFMWGVLPPHIKHCRENKEMICSPSSSLIKDIPGDVFNLPYDSIPSISFLFYHNSGKDSVGVTFVSLQYSPAFSFWGFLQEDSIIVSFGAVRENDDELLNIKECVMKRYNLCVDEQAYVNTVDRVTSGSSFCGPVEFHYYQVDECLPQLIRRIEDTLCEKKHVRFDMMYRDSSVLFEFKLPQGKHSTQILMTSDVGGVGCAHVYSYENGATLYISNDISLCPELKGKDSLLIGNAISIETDSPSYSDIDGYDLDSGYFRDWQSKDICIGYYGVTPNNKAEFDTAIESLCVCRKSFKRKFITPESIL